MIKIEFSMKKILLILLTIILVIGTIKFINFQKQDTISINAIALDNYGYLESEEFELKAKEIGNDLYEIELPESINEKVVAQAVQVVLENDVVEIEDNKIVLTKEQVENEKINLEVSYDVAILEKTDNETYKKNLLKDTTEEERNNIEITEETEVLYSKILKHEDATNGKLVELSGFLPKDAQLQVEEVSQDKITEIFGDKKIDVAYDIKILMQDENGETVKVNPEDFGETCEVLIKDENIVTNSKVYHVKDDNTLETIEVKENTEQAISFEAKSFSVYAVASDDVTIEDEGGVLVGATATLDKGMTDVDDSYEWVKSITVTISDPGILYKYITVGYSWSTSTEIPTSYTAALDLEDSLMNDTEDFTVTSPSTSGVEVAYYLHMRVYSGGYDGDHYKNLYTGPYYIDTKATAPTITKTPNTTWTNGEFSFQASATDNGCGSWHYEYKINDGEIKTSYNGKQTFTPGEGAFGTHKIAFRTVDTLGNVSGWTQSSMSVDTLSPTLTINPSSTTDASSSTNITITASDTGGSGLSSSNSYQYYLSTSNITRTGGSWTTYTGGKEFSIGSGKTGKYYIWLKAVTDNAGNTSTASGGTDYTLSGETFHIFGPYNFESEPPTYTVSPSSDSTYSKGKTVNIVITDDEGFSETPTEATVKFKWHSTETNGGDDEAEKTNLSEDGKTFTATYTSSVWRTGKYYLGYTINITDSAGNTLAEEGCAGPYYIDNSAPTITLGTNENTTWSKTASVVVTLKDDRSKLASGASIKYGWSTSNTTEPTTYKDATLSYSAGATSTTFTATATGLSGKYYLWVKPVTLKDQLGNSQTTNTISTGTFYMDNTAPTAGTMQFTLGSATGSAYTSGNWTNKDVYLKLTNGTDTLSGHSSTTYTIDGKASTATSITTEGTHEIVITTKDAVGNSSTKTYTVKIDKTAPTAGTMQFTLGSATGSTYTAGNWTNKDVYLKLTNGTDTASGHESTTYTINGKTSTATSITTEGTHTIVITTKDIAGNSATKTYTVKIDKTAPTAGTMQFTLGSALGSAYTSGNWTNQDVYLKLTNGTDTASGHGSTTYTIDGKASTATSITTEGTHTIVITTKDTVGNSATKTYTVKIDKTKPEWGTETINVDKDKYEITAILKGQDEVGLAEITFDTSKLTVEIGDITIDSKDITCESAELSTDGKTRTITIKITYANELQNIKEKDASIIIDSTALVDLAGNASNSKTYSFTIEISDIITSNTLTVTEEQLLIRDINPKTTAKVLRENLESEMQYNIVNANGEVVTEDTIVGSGYKVRMLNGKEYTLIVRGDINGDGQIGLGDLARISRIFISSSAEPSELETLAIDVSKNGKIELNDITVISRLKLAE